MKNPSSESTTRTLPVLSAAQIVTQPEDAKIDGFSVLDACHADMLKAASALERLVTVVLKDAVTPLDKASAAAVAEFYATTARRHHEDEERHVFPAMLASGNPELVQAALRLQQDHGWLEEDWMELESHVQAIATGIGQCDIDVLRQGVEVFAALHRDHIALEESVAYPQAQAQLGPAGRRAMGREMAARRRAERAGRATAR